MFPSNKICSFERNCSRREEEERRRRNISGESGSRTSKAMKERGKEGGIQIRHNPGTVAGCCAHAGCRGYRWVRCEGAKKRTRTKGFEPSRGNSKGKGISFYVRRTLSWPRTIERWPCTSAQQKTEKYSPGNKVREPLL